MNTKKEKGRRGPKSRSKDRAKSRSRSPAKGKKGKLKGHKPSDWSKEELLDKLRVFAQFNVDRTSGSAMLVVKEKRLMSEDLQIICETFVRFTEVQHVTFQKCYLNDEIFAELASGFRNLRHLKSLVLPYNMLTSASVSLVISTYASSTRRLEALDFRDNNGVTDEDGRRLFVNFGSYILNLHGIQIQDIKKKREELLDLSDNRIRGPETSIVCGLLDSLGNLVKELNISRNLIGPKALIQLAKQFKKMRYLVNINLSFNPLMGLQGNDSSGVTELKKTTRNTSHIIAMNLIATRILPEDLSTIMGSLQVNRTLTAGAGQNGLFDNFVTSQLVKRAPSDPVNALDTWKPKFEVDVVFSKINRISIRECFVDPTDPNNEIQMKLVEDTRKRNYDL